MKYEKPHQKILLDFVLKAYEELVDLCKKKDDKKILEIKGHVCSHNDLPERLIEAYNELRLYPSPSCRFSEEIRDANQVLGGTGIKGEVLEALRRYEAYEICPLFDKCPYSKCDGTVHCQTYRLNKGGYDDKGIDKEARKKLMLEIFRDEGFELDNKD